MADRKLTQLDSFLGFLDRLAVLPIDAFLGDFAEFLSLRCWLDLNRVLQPGATGPLASTLALTDRGRNAGASTEDIARQALREDFGGWSDAHRLVADVDTIRRDQEGDRRRRDPLDVIAMMARLARD